LFKRSAGPATAALAVPAALATAAWASAAAARVDPAVMLQPLPVEVPRRPQEPLGLVG
jgi:hypothetical protein